MNVICLGTQQQRPKGTPVTNSLNSLWPGCTVVRLHGWTSVFAAMTWVGLFFFYFMTRFLGASPHLGCLSSIVTFMVVARAPP